MRLLLLFSLVLFAGCAHKEIVIKKVYIKSKCPVFDYNISVPKDVSLSLSQKNGKICLKKDQFIKLIDNYNAMKTQIKGFNKSLSIYKKAMKGINNE